MPSVTLDSVNFPLTFNVRGGISCSISGCYNVDIDFKNRLKPLMTDVIYRGAGVNHVSMISEEDGLIDNELGYSELSRYAVNKIVEYEDGFCFTRWDIPDIPKTQNDTFYTVEKGNENRLELISYMLYKTTQLWWVLASVNNISDPFVEVIAGTILRVPALSELYSYFVNKRR